jgi:hypothetical protein
MRPSFGSNLPQIVTHICQKAIFKHALEEVINNNELPDGYTQGISKKGNINKPYIDVPFDFESITNVIVNPYGFQPVQISHIKNPQIRFLFVSLKRFLSS